MVRPLILISVALSAATVIAATELRQLDELRARYRMNVFDSVPGIGDRLKRLKVAIIDNGFGDPNTLADDLPRELFKNVLVFPEAFLKKHPELGAHDEQVLTDDKEKHGREMALIAWAMTGMDRGKAPQFHLVNGRTLFNLKRAVQYCIDEKVDIILYSQNWEYGGNFDGRGFINAVVSKAIDAGILWINAAGNYGGRTFNASVKYLDGKKVASDDTWVDMKGKKELRLLSRLDSNPVRIVLSWNSYSETREAGTNRDLDLFLYDEGGSLVASSEYRQILGGTGVVPKEEVKEDFVPREIITTTLARNKSGHYTLRVKARSGRFDATDKFRIAIVPTKAPYYDTNERRMVESVELVDKTEGEEIMVPADHPDTIAVGDLTDISGKGPTMDAGRRTKPDLHLAQSTVEFTTGDSTGGTSNAAAMFAGIVAMLKATRNDITKAEILKFVKSKKPSESFKPGEAQGILDLEPDRVRAIHPLVMDALETRINDGAGKDGSPIVLTGRYKSGPFVFALDRPVGSLSRIWNNIPREGDNFEAFLYTARVRAGRFEVWCYVRPRERADGEKKGDWESWLERYPERFVQLIQAKPRKIDPKEKAVLMWDPPTSADQIKKK